MHQPAVDIVLATNRVGRYLSQTLQSVREQSYGNWRLVVVDESNPRCSLAADIVSLVSQNRFEALKAAPRAVTAPHTPVPFAPVLEDAYIPSVDKIAAAVRDLVGAGSRA